MSFANLGPETPSARSNETPHECNVTVCDMEWCFADMFTSVKLNSVRLFSKASFYSQNALNGC